jgi:hypothetical protein
MVGQSGCSMTSGPATGAGRLRRPCPRSGARCHRSKRHRRHVTGRGWRWPRSAGPGVPRCDTPHRYAGPMVLGVVIGLVVGAAGLVWHLVRQAGPCRRRPARPRPGWPMPRPRRPSLAPACRRPAAPRRRPRRRAPSWPRSWSCSRSRRTRKGPRAGRAPAPGRDLRRAVGRGAAEEQRAVPGPGRDEAQPGPDGGPGRSDPAPAGHRPAPGPAERDAGPLRARDCRRSRWSARAPTKG